MKRESRCWVSKRGREEERFVEVVVGKLKAFARVCSRVFWMMKKRGWLFAGGWYLSKKCRPEEGAGIWQNHRGNLTPQPTATPRAGSTASPVMSEDVSRYYEGSLEPASNFCANITPIALLTVVAMDGP